MATIKSFTDISQSKKLAEILPLGSADIYWCSFGERYYIGAMDDGDFNEKVGDVRAWSLAALLGVLPKIGAGEPMVIKLYYANEPKERYICEYGLTNMTSEYDNPVDACYEMIEKLHELNLL